MTFSVPPVPVIETIRLKLRGHRLEDFSSCAAMWADPLVTRFIGGKPSTEQQVWMRLMGYVGHWSLMGFGYWAVEEKATGLFVGELGFADFKRDIIPSIKGVPELGWALTPAFHGKGYATEALQGAMGWGDKNLKTHRTACIINPGNLASIRVAAKCGYKQMAQTTYNGEPTLMFERVVR
jgi:RimJ/RimL family protein N-acetyltransferase